MKKALSLILIAVIVFSAFLSGNVLGLDVIYRAESVINNSDVTPKYVPDSQVELEGEFTPDWVKTLIMVEVRLETCTKEGTLKSAEKILDHYAEMGVNGLWITPVADRNDSGDNNGYINYGPHTIYPKLTGTTDYKKGWEEFAKFVEKAHQKNIRIFLDITSWGVENLDVEILKQHPEFSTGIPDSQWGGIAFDWDNESFRKWYMQNMIDIAVNTNIDGYRLDVEPRHAGSAFHRELRQKLLKMGRKISLMSELGAGTDSTYDFQQIGVSLEAETGVSRQLKTPAWYLDGYGKIVDSIKSADANDYDGLKRFYTYDLVDHDCWDTAVKGNRLTIGYQALFTPYIPLWMMGEEFNGTKSNKVSQVFYFSPLDWDSLNNAKNRAFYEDVKKMIRIRRLYPEIFNYYPDDHKNSNICEVIVSGNEELQAYARYNGNKAILVIPNNNLHETDGKMTVYMPFEDMNLGNYKKYTVKDLLTGKIVVSGTKTQVSRFTATVQSENLGLYEVTAEGFVPIINKSEDDNNDSTVLDEPEDNTSSQKDENGKVKKTIRRKLVGTKGDYQFVIIIIIVCILLVITIGTVFFIILKRRKKKNNQQ